MRILPSIVAVLLMAIPAQAFDCAKATTEVERAICADPDLVALDARVAAAYDAVKALSSADQRIMLEKAQLRWIARRGKTCPEAEEGLPACIANMIRDRLALLEAKPDSGTPPALRIIPVFIVQDGTPAQYDLDITMLRMLDAKTPGDHRFNAIADEMAAMARLGPHGEDTQGRIYESIDSEAFRLASPKLYSVEQSYWSFTGGAHGYGGTNSFNFDPVTGRDYEFGDFFPEAAATALMASCKSQIMAEKTARLGAGYDAAKDTLLQDDIIAEHVATLGAWSFSMQAATIGFDAEVIGSHAEGGYDCRFPMADLKALALPAAPLP